MQYNWLFVVQNFEGKCFEDSAANIEVVEPLICSGYVKSHQTLIFNRHTSATYGSLVDNKVEQINNAINGEPIVIYGAGVHTEQNIEAFKKLNIVAFCDRDESLWGNELFGIPIISPFDIHLHAKKVLISSKAFEESISSFLTEQFPSLTIYTIYRNNTERKLFEDSMGNDISTSIEEHSPDIVFYCPTHPSDALNVNIWLAIKKSYPDIKFVTIWWDYDEDENASGYLQFERDCLKWNNLCIENSNSTRLIKMRQKNFPYDRHTNVDRVEFIPTVFSDKLFYPDKTVEKKYDIAIFGSAAGERKHYIEKLKEKYGEKFHHIGGLQHKNANAMLSIKEYADALRQTKICINTQTYPFREQCKGKVREALACGVLLLEEENAQTKTLLSDGEGIVFFNDFNDLINKVDGLLSGKDTEIKQIIDNGQMIWAEIGSVNMWANKILTHLCIKDEHEI